MPPLTTPFGTIAVAVLFLAGSVLGQEQSKPNTEFKILKIEPSYLESPAFSGPRFDKKSKSKSQWLEVEVTFEWQPPKTAPPKYTDELTFNYYILLEAKPQPILFIGSVTHMNISPGKDKHSSAYVSPKTFERFFDGKAPAVVDVGVAITKQGQEVASTGLKTKGAWWKGDPPKFPPIDGFVLNKNETPFAPLAWDYFEAIKPKKPEGQ